MVFGVRKGSPLYVAEKVTNPYGFVIEKPPILRGLQNPEINLAPPPPLLPTRAKRSK